MQTEYDDAAVMQTEMQTRSQIHNATLGLDTAHYYGGKQSVRIMEGNRQYVERSAMRTREATAAQYPGSSSSLPTIPLAAEREECAVQQQLLAGAVLGTEDLQSGDQDVPPPMANLRPMDDWDVPALGSSAWAESVWRLQSHTGAWKWVEKSVELTMMKFESFRHIATMWCEATPTQTAGVINVLFGNEKKARDDEDERVYRRLYFWTPITYASQNCQRTRSKSGLVPSRHLVEYGSCPPCETTCWVRVFQRIESDNVWEETRLEGLDLRASSTGCTYAYRQVNVLAKNRRNGLAAHDGFINIVHLNSSTRLVMWTPVEQYALRPKGGTTVDIIYFHPCGGKQQQLLAGAVEGTEDLLRIAQDNNTAPMLPPAAQQPQHTSRTTAVATPFANELLYDTSSSNAPTEEAPMDEDTSSSHTHNPSGQTHGDDPVEDLRILQAVEQLLPQLRQTLLDVSRSAFLTCLCLEDCVAKVQDMLKEEKAKDFCRKTSYTHLKAVLTKQAPEWLIFKDQWTRTHKLYCRTEDREWWRERCKNSSIPHVSFEFLKVLHTLDYDLRQWVVPSRAVGDQTIHAEWTEALHLTKNDAVARLNGRITSLRPSDAYGMTSDAPSVMQYEEASGRRAAVQAHPSDQAAAPAAPEQAAVIDQAAAPVAVVAGQSGQQQQITGRKRTLDDGAATDSTPNKRPKPDRLNDLLNATTAIPAPSSDSSAPVSHTAHQTRGISGRTATRTNAPKGQEKKQKSNDKQKQTENSNDAAAAKGVDRSLSRSHSKLLAPRERTSVAPRKPARKSAVTTVSPAPLCCSVASAVLLSVSASSPPAAAAAASPQAYFYPHKAQPVLHLPLHETRPPLLIPEVCTELRQHGYVVVQHSGTDAHQQYGVLIDSGAHKAKSYNTNMLLVKVQSFDLVCETAIQESTAAHADLIKATTELKHELNSSDLLRLINGVWRVMWMALTYKKELTELEKQKEQERKDAQLPPRPHNVPLSELVAECPSEYAALLKPQRYMSDLSALDLKKPKLKRPSTAPLDLSDDQAEVEARGFFPDATPELTQYNDQRYDSYQATPEAATTFLIWVAEQQVKFKKVLGKQTSLTPYMHEFRYHPQSLFALSRVDLMGAATPYMYLKRDFSFFLLHREQCGLGFWHTQYSGKVLWILIHDSDGNREKLDQALEKLCTVHGEHKMKCPESTCPCKLRATSAPAQNDGAAAMNVSDSDSEGDAAGSSSSHSSAAAPSSSGASSGATPLSSAEVASPSSVPQPWQASFYAKQLFPPPALLESYGVDYTVLILDSNQTLLARGTIAHCGFSLSPEVVSMAGNFLTQEWLTDGGLQHVERFFDWVASFAALPPGNLTQDAKWLYKAINHCPPGYTCAQVYGIQVVVRQWRDWKKEGKQKGKSAPVLVPEFRESTVDDLSGWTERLLAVISQIHSKAVRAVLKECNAAAVEAGDKLCLCQFGSCQFTPSRAK